MVAKRILAVLACCVLGVVVMSAQEKYEYNEYYYQKSSLFERLPIGSFDIVFLGDSQTDGCEWSEMLRNPHVKNRGISSDIVQGFIDRVGPIVKGKPAKVFILGGINDISHNVTPDSLATCMRRLIETIKAGSPQTRIYLQSLLPIDNSFRRYKNILGKEQDVVETNRLYRKVAEETGAVWIDLFSVMADPETGNMRKGLTNDGLHLLAEGYELWVRTVRPYVEE